MIVELPENLWAWFAAPLYLAIVVGTQFIAADPGIVLFALLAVMAALPSAMFGLIVATVCHVAAFLIFGSPTEQAARARARRH